jgi:hypothetical protein
MDAVKKTLELGDRTRKKCHQSLHRSRHSGATISEGKEFLATDPEVPGSIPGPTSFSDK